MLVRGLRAQAAEDRRAALKSWLTFAASWQVLVVVAVLLYLATSRRDGSSDLFWIAPPVAAVVGTALPLQLVAMRLLRAARME